MQVSPHGAELLGREEVFGILPGPNTPYELI